MIEKKLKNFKLFIIMDTDDCDEQIKQEYISGKLFQNHLLKDYIVPIYNINNLEDVMLKANVMVTRIKKSQKGDYYSKIFPINNKQFSVDSIKQVTDFNNKISGLRITNLNIFVEYCLGFIKE